MEKGMKWWKKVLLILLTSFIFYLLSGSGTGALTVLVVIGYWEFIMLPRA